MSNIEEMKNQVSPEEVDAQIRKVIGYLVNEGAHVGCVSGCLIHHATILQSMVCNDPVVTFEFILGQLFDSIPRQKDEFDEKLIQQITHYQSTDSLN